MKLIEIRKFLGRIESAFEKLSFQIESFDDFYYCTKDNKHCIVVPYISSADFSFPNYNNCYNYIIISNGDMLGNTADIKFITIEEFENALKLWEKSPDLLDRFFDFYFFNTSFGDFANILSGCSGKDMREKSSKSSPSVKKKIEEGLYSVDISIIENALGQQLFNQKKYYCNSSTCVIPIISKLYDTGKYWYGYHDYQIEILNKYDNPYMAFFFKDRQEVLLMTKKGLDEYFDKLNSTKKDAKQYWHLYFKFKGSKCLWQIPNNGYKDVSQFLINKREYDDNSNFSNKNIEDTNVIKITSYDFHEAKAKK